MKCRNVSPRRLAAEMQPRPVIYVEPLRVPAKVRDTYDLLYSLSFWAIGVACGMAFAAVAHGL